MKTLFKIVIKAILLMSIFLILTGYLTYVFNPNENKSYYPKIKSLPKNSLDVVVLGSSHAQYGINPAVIYSESQLYSFINGSACQPIEVSYQMLRETYKTQNPKVVVLDVFTLLPSKSVCQADSIYKMAADEMTGLEKIKTLSYVGDKGLFLDYLFGIRMYHQRWPEIKLSDFVYTKKNEELLDFGYVFLKSEDLNFRYYPEATVKEHVKIDAHSKKYLEKIKALTQQKHSKLVLVKTPYMYTQEDYDILQGIWAFARNNDIDVVDFIALSKEMDFAFGIDSETWHNTNFGAYKNSVQLAAYLKTLNIFNHRENHLMNNALKGLENLTLSGLLDGMPDPYRFLKYTSEYDNISVIRYIGHHKTSIQTAENELLQSLGTSHDFINQKNQNYFAIINHHEVIAEGSKEAVATINGKELRSNAQGIFVEGESTLEEDGELVVAVISEDYAWQRVMNINYASQWFWKVGCDSYVCH